MLQFCQSMTKGHSLSFTCAVLKIVMEFVPINGSIGLHFEVMCLLSLSPFFIF